MAGLRDAVASEALEANRAASGLIDDARFGKPVAGTLHVDEGAQTALVDKGASLLGVGVARCEGRFERGMTVELVGPDGVAFGKGIAGTGADELAGRPRGLEAVHRDRLVLF